MYDCIIYVYTYTGKYNHTQTLSSDTHITQYSRHLIICQFLLEERTVALPASVFNREIFRVFADVQSGVPEVSACIIYHEGKVHMA